jgi:hypothetical protein
MQLGLQPCTANDVLNDDLIRAIFMEQTYTPCNKSMAAPCCPSMYNSGSAASGARHAPLKG